MKKIFIIVSFLVLLPGILGLLSFATGNAAKLDIETEVLVVGTIHGGHFTGKNYLPAVLLGVIKAAKPDVVAIEVRPEDFAAKNYTSSPIEISMIIIPYCEDNNIITVPMDWWTEPIAIAMIKAKQKAGQNDELENIFIEENKIFSKGFPKGMKYPQDFIKLSYEDVNSQKFSNAVREAYKFHYECVGDGPLAGYWEYRNSMMMKNIMGIVNKYTGKRIVICVGAEHKYWFDDYLAKQKNIKLLQLNNVREIKPVEKLPAKTEDYLKKSRLLVICSKLMDGKPGSVDTTGVYEELQDILKNDPQNAVFCKFCIGYYEYIKKNYPQALSDFIESTGDPDYKAGQNYLQPLAWMWAGNMYDLLGEREKAIDMYNKVLNSDKSFKYWKINCEKYISSPFKRP